MKKTYFSDVEEDYANTLDFILDEMKERELTEIIVSEAQRETKSDYFYCKKTQECGEKGECCKLNCEFYEPRNKKGGCCKHFGFTYQPGTEYKLTIDGDLIPINDRCNNLICAGHILTNNLGTYFEVVQKDNKLKCLLNGKYYNIQPHFEIIGNTLQHRDIYLK